MSYEKVKKYFNINKSKFLLITFHSSTLENNTSTQQFKNILSFLKTKKNFNIIFTKTNADTDGRIINQLIDKFVLNNKNSSAYTSLGQIKYLSLLKYSYALIGNSSSGIIETPYFKKPTINIGERQEGRVKAKNIIDCNPNFKSLEKSFKKIEAKNFKKKNRKYERSF